jgi:hypothetical protein
MDNSDATYDFPEYLPHISLSYNVGDLKPGDLGDPTEIGDIEIVDEYTEQLNTDWAENKV